MAKETLRAQVYEFDDDLAITEINDTHVVDSSLSTANAAYDIQEWDTNELLVTWGSRYDDPVNDMEARSKFAILHYDDLEDTNFIQETFDTYLSLPEAAEEAPLISRRMGTSEKILVTGGGGYNKAPSNAQGNSRDPWADGFSALQWSRDGQDYNNPTDVTVNIWPGSDSSLSAVMVDQGSGDQVLGVWAIEGNTSIVCGLAPDVDSFFNDPQCITSVTTLWEDLESANCSIYRNPNNGFLYIVWCTRRLNGTNYIDTDNWFYYDTNSLSNTNFATDRTNLPWTVIYKSTDEGVTWNYYSFIQAPYDDLEVLGYNPGPHATSITPVGAAAADTGARDGSTIIGTPYFNDDGMYLPAVQWHASEISGDWYEDTGQIVWHTGNGLGDPQQGWSHGITWTIVFVGGMDRPYQMTGALVDNFEDLLPGSACSMSVVEFDGTLYWANHTADDPNGAMRIWQSDDGGATWGNLTSTIYSYQSYQTSPTFVIDPTWNAGADALFLLLSGTLYKAELPFAYTILSNQITGQVDIPDLTDIAPYRLQEIDDRTALMAAAIPVVIGMRSASFHNGIYSFIVDRCSEG